ncbi:MAG: hypothetical protein KIS92_17075 [Planctomycetota bacterium]|nr:hypothetical protein [Planctomycetota bacterium]
MPSLKRLLPALLILPCLAACGSKGTGTAYKPKEDTEKDEKPAKDKRKKPPEEAAADPKEEEPVVRPPEPVANGQVLQFSRNIGKVTVYEASFEREQTGKNRATESGTFYLTYYPSDRDKGSGLDLVAIRRTWLDRKRLEVTEQGKKVDKILPLNEELIDLGPNFKETAGRLRCYGFDAQNNIAQFFEDELTMQDGTILRGHVVKDDENTTTIETNEGQREVAKLRVKSRQRIYTPHLLIYDSPHYFFPILSSKPVAAGSTWGYTVQMVIPLNQGGGGVMPTQFPVKLTAKLRALQGGVATIDYTARGEFDSDKPPFSERFGEQFRQRNRMIHAIDLSGTITLDVKSGTLLEKVEDMKVHMEATAIVPVAPNQAPQQNHTEADITGRFRMKWLPPGTKLKSGVEVPPNE